MTDECPYCGCEVYMREDFKGKGFRECYSCEKEWWVNVDYSDIDREIL